MPIRAAKLLDLQQRRKNIVRDKQQTTANYEESKVSWLCSNFCDFHKEYNKMLWDYTHTRSGMIWDGGSGGVRGIVAILFSVDSGQVYTAR